ncbi:type III-B CRISPR module-associated Cmr3 family protein [Azospirillum lipoferum]|uniref:CRISPR-associated protein Cmr3 n=1 Tax=Azospirillum lipoferum (strain 4B) TaxID=862719 RepID=G7ZCE0_AZOL4|nr:type III-B CRISPR module-associated Cmr3 family protein [Azospirillum lipoferum]CBS89280.1 protein of unknown function [Azospirillum lipoferum 4B]
MSAAHRTRLDFLVEPAEALLFGPPRGFSAGEAHRVASQFPPTPQAFQGMVRTRLLLGGDLSVDLNSRAGAALVPSLVGTADRLPEGWRIDGPFPARRGKDGIVRPWVATPRFLLMPPKDADGATVHQAHFRSADPQGGLSDRAPKEPGGDTLPGRPELGDMRPPGGWIDPANLHAVLSGAPQGWRAGGWCCDLPPFVKRESQSGVAIDARTGRTRHGMLYFSEALRFASGSGLLGGFTGTLAPSLSAAALTTGAGQAGRKGRLVRFAKAERLDPDWLAVREGRYLPDRVTEADRFWLVALTPARRSKAAELPIRTPRGSAVSVRVVAALAGPPVVLGGFDLAGGKPRSNWSYHPAGSAWLIQLTGGDDAARAALLRDLHDSHILGDENEAVMGFGHALVGLCERKQEETGS